MKVVVDSKRRVVLPKSVEPGEIFEIFPEESKMIMLRLQRPAVVMPLQADTPLQWDNSIDLDEPAFPLLTNESPA